MSATALSPRPLTDSFSALLAYVVDFRQNVRDKQPAYETVRQDILRLIKESEACITKGYCTLPDYDQGRYALCAWIDESVLGSAWNSKNRWRPELLQRLYYQSADAGEKFFQRLKDLEAHQRGIREVYYLCLALGFKGRYCGPDDSEALEQLKERQLKLLFSSASETPSVAVLEKSTLFPEAYAPSAAPARVKRVGRPWGWIVALIAPILILIGLFMTYRFTLYGVGENILKSVRS